MKDSVHFISQALEFAGCSIIITVDLCRAISHDFKQRCKSLFPSSTWGVRHAGGPSGKCRGRRGPPASKFLRGLKPEHGGAAQSHTKTLSLMSPSTNGENTSPPYKMSIGSSTLKPESLKAAVMPATPAKISSPKPRRACPGKYFCAQEGGILGGGSPRPLEGWSAGFTPVLIQSSAKATCPVKR